jgi:hypothetical protein
MTYLASAFKTIPCIRCRYKLYNELQYKRYTGRQSLKGQLSEQELTRQFTIRARHKQDTRSACIENDPRYTGSSDGMGITFSKR